MLRASQGHAQHVGQDEINLERRADRLSPLVLAYGPAISLGQQRVIFIGGKIGFIIPAAPDAHLIIDFIIGEKPL